MQPLISIKPQLRKAVKFLNKSKARLFFTPLSEKEFLKSKLTVEESDLELYLKSRTRGKSFFQLDQTEIIQSYFSSHNEEATQLIQKADQFCEHRFDLLGHYNLDCTKIIDWHKDYPSDYSWDPKTFYTDIKIPYDQADIKFPWELSRFYHLITLGQAYVLTSDEKYAQEFIDQVSDWIDKNPVQHGVNWNCTMEVAIRATNLSTAISFFLNSNQLSARFIQKFFKSMYDHGRHIRSNLEYNPIANGNHYVANLTGLLYIGIYFPEFLESSQWTEFAIKELKKEILIQVYPDGTDYEASTCYHRLVLELFFYPTLLAVKNDPNFDGENYSETGLKIFGPAYMERLKAMFTATLHLLKPNGYMPQIGDNDNGQVHKFNNRDVLDMRYLLGLGTVFFKDSTLKVEEFGFDHSTLWLFGANGLNTWESLAPNSLPRIESKLFSNSGWCVLRNNKDYMIVSCGPNGKKGQGTHCHNDKLSFELMINGEDIVIDPGVYTYTQDIEERNFFRSTNNHNTVTVNGQEQSCINPGKSGLWEMGEDPKPKILSWKPQKDKDKFIGEYLLKEGGVHRREIQFHKAQPSKWTIKDSVLGQKIQKITWNFILSPKISPKLITSDQLNFREDRTYYSRFYGDRSETKRLSASMDQGESVEITIAADKGHPAE